MKSNRNLITGLIVLSTALLSCERADQSVVRSLEELPGRHGILLVLTGDEDPVPVELTGIYRVPQLPQEPHLDCGRNRSIELQGIDHAAVSGLLDGAIVKVKGVWKTEKRDWGGVSVHIHTKLTVELIDVSEIEVLEEAKKTLTKQCHVKSQPPR